MSVDQYFANIEPKAASAVPTAAQVVGGIPVPPVRLLQVMSWDDWEGFTEEWLTFHKGKGTYQSIKRYSGPGVTDRYYGATHDRGYGASSKMPKTGLSKWPI